MVLWRPHARWLIGGALVALAALAAGLVLMAEAGALVVVAAAGGAAGGLLLRVVGPLRVVLRYAERLATHDALFRALASLRVWFFRGLAGRAAGGLGFRQAGDVLSRIVSDIEALDVVYVRVLVPLAGAVVLVPVLGWWIGRHDGVLAVVVVGLFGVTAFGLPFWAAKAAWREGARLAEAAAGLRIACLDTLSGLREVRAFGAEGRMLALVQGREAALLAAQHALAGRAALAGAGAFLCGQAALLAVLVAAAASGSVPLAGLAFLVVAGFEAVVLLARVGVLAGHATRAADRVVELADAPPPAIPPPGSTPSAKPGDVMPSDVMPSGSAIRFEAVGFTWQAAPSQAGTSQAGRALVFDGLSLDIAQGSRVALLGPSGAGKSTFAALLLKVARPDRGRVLLGGVDIARLPDDAVRARCAWLSQSTHLFSDTIRANLLLGRPDADEPALWAALAAARIADLVRALPDGLDAWVGEGGLNFSGGQGRRLALARALLSTAPVLILDEPCAGLDAATEREFFAALNATAEGRTVVLIAHRLVGVERLDRIFRLSGGRAVAAAG